MDLKYSTQNFKACLVSVFEHTFEYFKGIVFGEMGILFC